MYKNSRLQIPLPIKKKLFVYILSGVIRNKILVRIKHEVVFPAIMGYLPANRLTRLIRYLDGDTFMREELCSCSALEIIWGRGKSVDDVPLYLSITKNNLELFELILFETTKLSGSIMTRFGMSIFEHILQQDLSQEDACMYFSVLLFSGRVSEDEICTMLKSANKFLPRLLSWNLITGSPICP